MKNYDPKKIESKWQKEWEKKKVYQVKDFKKDKFYALVEFPYPSGDGLHVGHPRPYIGMDIISRKRRMEGKNVLFPFGWDAFGLPTENFAIKTGIHPKIVTKKNTDNFRRQTKMLGISFDWSREINTTDPEYYKWTQWIFLQFFKRGLAYKKEVEINWCSSCKIGLANEEAVGGICDRCGGPVEKRMKSQWMLGITKYAERLDKDLDLVDYPERVKLQQKNWIGKSEGSEIDFKIKYSPSPTLPKGKGENTPGYYMTDAKTWRLFQDKVLEMRKNPTEAEKKLWQKLRGDKNNFHFRQQHIINNFIVDFVCLSKKLIIEVDGDIHDLQKEKDFERTGILETLGFKVIRFRNEEVLNDLDKVIRKINETLENPSLWEGQGWAEKIKVFTTRADTLFGATYVVLAPEHELVQKLLPNVLNKKEVEEYIKKVKSKSDLERTENKIKTGVELKGIKAINPANQEEIPIWIADYVLPHYGTGAVMAVPAHDERDFEFAKKYDLPIRRVIIPNFNFARSIVWGQNITKNDLENIGVKIIEEIKTNNVEYNEMIRKVEIPLEKINDFEKLILEKVSKGYWNEYVGPDGVIYNFKQTDTTSKRIKLSVDTEKEIAKFCYEFFYKKSIDSDWKPKNMWKSLARAEGNFYLPMIIHTQDGILESSGKFNELNSIEARKKITEFVGGKMVIKFKLRDWVFSRQRYWGEPIPLIYCEKDGWVSVPEKDLPVKLPEVKSYKLTDTGESPLAGISKWVNVKCPKCGGKAKRETDTMPNWAGSSWYYLRYADPKNKKVFADKKKLKYWLQPTPSPFQRKGKNQEALPFGEGLGGAIGGVDWYNGGMEHTTLHLLYSRFWHKFLYDLKLVPTVEPYKKRTSHGMILAEGGVKMSKSKGNVVNPDEIVKIYGADTLRVYEMFLGPFEDTAVWNTESIIGSRRFLEKVWRMGEKISKQENSPLEEYPKGEVEKISTPSRKRATPQEGNISLQKLLHKTIKKVSEDIEAMRFNTAISAMMILAGEMEKSLPPTPSKGRGALPLGEGLGGVVLEDFKKFLQILAPFAPHVAEEIWNLLGEKKTINFSKWPKWDEKLIKDDEIKIAVQVNGKVRTEIMIQVSETEEEIKKKALKNQVILKFIEGKETKKVIYVKNRLVNVVV